MNGCIQQHHGALAAQVKGRGLGEKEKGECEGQKQKEMGVG